MKLQTDAPIKEHQLDTVNRTTEMQENMDEISGMMDDPRKIKQKIMTPRGEYDNAHNEDA